MIGSVSQVALAAVLALIPLVGLVPAQGASQTFIVDIYRRPGSQFAQIQPAIDAARAGDVVLVRTSLPPGNTFPGLSYEPFTLSKGLSIIAADPYVFGHGESIIRDVPADERVLLRGIQLGTMTILDCEGLVAGDTFALIAPRELAGSLDTATLDITNCRDVRMRQFGMNNGGFTGRDGVRVRNSRFEVDGGSIDGADGAIGRRGGIGVWCQEGSTVNIFFSRIRGGDAGLANLPGSPAILPGGAAILVSEGASLQLNGNIEMEVIGGWSGCPAVGAGVRVLDGGSVRISGDLRITGGSAPLICGGETAALFGRGDFDIADQKDLGILFRGGISQVGLAAGIEVHGEPGDVVFMLAGVESAITPLPNIRNNPLLLAPTGIFPLGIMPAGSELFLPLTLPRSLPPGLLLVVQAVSMRADGRFFLSNASFAVSG